MTPLENEATKILIKAVEKNSQILINYDQLSVLLMIDHNYVPIQEIIDVNVNMALAWFISHSNIFSSSIGVGNENAIRPLNFNTIERIKKMDEVERQIILNTHYEDTGIITVIKQREKKDLTRKIILKWLETNESIVEEPRIVLSYPTDIPYNRIIIEFNKCHHRNIKFILDKNYKFKEFSTYDDALIYQKAYSLKKLKKLNKKTFRLQKELEKFKV